MDLQVKEGEQNEENYIKADYKQTKDCRWLLALNLKPFRSQVKGKHSRREKDSKSSCERTGSVNKDILTSRNVDRKIIQSIQITSRPSARMRK